MRCKLARARAAAGAAGAQPPPEARRGEAAYLAMRAHLAALKAAVRAYEAGGAGQ